MKKLIAFASAAAFLVSAAPALASTHIPSNDIEVENDNWAKVSNEVTVVANTGDNEVVAVKGGTNNGDVDIDTGDAFASSVVQNVVNSNTTKIKASCRRGCVADIEVENDNRAKVRNEVRVIADTGNNEVVAVKGGTNNGDVDITTGDAEIWSDVVNIVNSNVTRIRKGR